VRSSGGTPANLLGIARVDIKRTPNHRQIPPVRFKTTLLSTAQDYPITEYIILTKPFSMNKLFQRVDRIRASGYATLNLEPSSPHYHLNGKRFPVQGMDKPALKSRVTLLVEGKPMDFTINEIL